MSDPSKAKLSDIKGGYGESIEIVSNFDNILKQYENRANNRMKAFQSMERSFGIVRRHLKGDTRAVFDHFVNVQIKGWEDNQATIWFDKNNNRKPDPYPKEKLRDLFARNMDIKKLEAMLVEAKNELDSTKKERNDFKEKSAECLKREEELQKNLNAREAKKTELEAKKAELETKKAELEKANKTLTAEKRDLSKDLEKASLRCESQKKDIQLANKGATIDRLNKKNEKVENEAKLPIWKRFLKLIY